MGARAWSLFPTRNVHLFWRMFTSPVFVSWTSWKHTDCLMWNRKKFLAFYCESIWPDFGILEASCSWLLLCFLSSIKALQRQISVWVCVCCAVLRRPMSASLSHSLSFVYNLQLTSWAADLCVTQRLHAIQESFKSPSVAANAERSQGSDSFPSRVPHRSLDEFESPA